MIIVSQDKDVIVNFDNVENVWINNPLENDEGKFEIRAESYSNNMLIGEYETEERAKEVLAEIVDTYTKIGTTFKTYSGVEKQAVSVYEMPEG